MEMMTSILFDRTMVALAGATTTLYSDDPHMTSQNQLAPAIDVEELGIVVVGWEDWRDPEASGDLCDVVLG